MNFWDDLGRKVSKGTKTFSQKSVEIFEIAKVKLDIASEKDKIGRLYEEIGKSVYRDYKQGSLKEKQTTDKCKAIDELNRKIDRLNRKVTQIKGSTLCKGCGEVVGFSQEYCHVCGRELERHTRIVEEGDDFRVEISNGLMCDKCGALVQEASEFCPACGKRF